MALLQRIMSLCLFNALYTAQTLDSLSESVINTANYPSMHQSVDNQTSCSISLLVYSGKLIEHFVLTVLSQYYFFVALLWFGVNGVNRCRYCITGNSDGGDESLISIIKHSVNCSPLVYNITVLNG